MKTAVVICIDSNYIEPAAVFLDSLSENYHYRESLDVICIMPEEDSGYFKKLESLVNLSLNLELFLKVVPNSEYGWMNGLSVGEKIISPSMWHRLFLGSLLPDYDKAIYFDPDMIVVDNIKPILEHPLKGKIMAVYDTIGVPYLYNLHRGEIAHFVTGMLIIDLNWWRLSGIENKIKDDLLINSPHELLDEYLLNKYAIDEWYPLPISFNFTAFTFDKYGVPDWDSTYLPEAFYRHAIVFHYAGPIKPWNFNDLAGTDKSINGAEWRRRRDLLYTKREPKGLGEK